MTHGNSSGMSLDALSSEMNLTKPTILHHLERLISIEIVEKDTTGTGIYFVKQVVRVSVVRGVKSELERTILHWIPLLCVFLLLGMVSVFVVRPFEILFFILICAVIGCVLVIREIRKSW